MGVGGGVLTPFLVPCADEGAAPKMRNIGGIAQTLSIHVPARARQYTDSISLNRGAFNPRASEGATPFLGLAVYRLKSFNPRASEGATKAMEHYNRFRQTFNPRASEGATRFDTSSCVTICAFNSRASEGATRHLTGPLHRKITFNPRASEGATRILILQKALPQLSIHAPVRARLALFLAIITSSDLSIHAPARARRGS